MKWQKVFGVVLAVLVLLWGAEMRWMRLATGSQAADRKAHGLVSDFNGDGFADLAVGVPQDDVGGIEDAGSVTVFYGSAQGVSATNQLWHQDRPGMLDAAERNDEFGSSLATGDFNGDGFSDLAVGVSDETVGSILAAGAVSILYGSAEGLSAAGNQFWHQDSPGIEGTAGVGEEFGRSLAVGDFNGDGFADLAIGVPFEGGAFNAYGAVNVLYGSSTGLTAAGNQLWDQDSPGVKGAREGGDFFGFALSVGDYNGDGFIDLAVGVPAEDLDSKRSAGVVNVLYGSPDGLSAAGNQFWHQDRRGVEDVVEEADTFGVALASGDFNGDGFADLAVGVAGEDIGTIGDAGAVNVLYGSPSGLSAEGNQFWHQDSPEMKDRAEDGDNFGFALTAGDFNGDGVADLAVGVPFEDLEPLRYAGAVNVLYGSLSGLSEAGNQFSHQDRPGIKDVAEFGDAFGLALIGRDYDHDGFLDLAIGVPYEDIRDVEDAGAVHVLYGAAGVSPRRGTGSGTGAAPGSRGRPNSGRTSPSPSPIRDLPGSSAGPLITFSESLEGPHFDKLSLRSWRRHRQSVLSDSIMMRR